MPHHPPDYFVPYFHEMRHYSPGILDQGTVVVSVSLGGVAVAALFAAVAQGRLRVVRQSVLELFSYHGIQIACLVGRFSVANPSSFVSVVVVAH